MGWSEKASLGKGDLEQSFNRRPLEDGRHYQVFSVGDEAACSMKAKGQACRLLRC